MQIDIRLADSGDDAPICELIKNELGYQQLDADKLCARLRRMEADDRHATAVAVVDGQVAGFIGLYRGIAYNCDGEYIQILALAVSERYRRKGVGSRLLRWAETYAAERGINSFGVNSGVHRAGAHIFYERSGYVKKSYGFGKDI